MYIQCIYKGQKSGKKTNRCQTNINQKLMNVSLQIDFYLITYLTYPKRKVIKKIGIKNPKNKNARESVETTKNAWETAFSVGGLYNLFRGRKGETVCRQRQQK